MKRILVTGGAGFVGSHLVDRLVALGHRVTVLDDLSSGLPENIPADAALVEGDVYDRVRLAHLIEGADACFHLAAIASVPQCNESWIKSHAVNLAAFVGVLESATKRREGVIPVVYASSAAVYGDTDVLPTPENLPLHPLSVYGADKAGCEMHARAAGQTGHVPTFGVRPFNIYGPRQQASSPYAGVISAFADRLKRGENVTIYGDGSQTRDFIHVSDVVTILVAALDKASVNAPVVNVATGHETSILDVAHLLGAVLGCKTKIDFAPARTGDIHRSVADISNMKSIFGMTPHIGIAEGLRFVLES